MVRQIPRLFPLLIFPVYILEAPLQLVNSWPLDLRNIYPVTFSPACSIVTSAPGPAILSLCKIGGTSGSRSTYPAIYRQYSVRIDLSLGLRVIVSTLRGSFVPLPRIRQHMLKTDIETCIVRKGGLPALSMKILQGRFRINFIPSSSPTI